MCENRITPNLLFNTTGNIVWSLPIAKNLHAVHYYLTNRQDNLETGNSCSMKSGKQGWVLSSSGM